MLGVVVFDLTKKYIVVFFLLIYSADYFNFVGYNVMLRSLKVSDAQKLKKRTGIFFIVMNILYLLNLILAFTDLFGPWCSPHVYPLCFTFAAALYWMNYSYHTYLKSNHYFIHLDTTIQVNGPQDSTILIEQESNLEKKEKRAECKRRILFTS
jgi:hypothetical protein